VFDLSVSNVVNAVFETMVRKQGLGHHGPDLRKRPRASSQATVLHQIKPSTIFAVLFLEISVAFAVRCAKTAG